MAKACGRDNCLGLCAPGETYCPAHKRARDQYRRDQRAAVAGDGAASRLRRYINRVGQHLCGSCLGLHPAHGLEVDHVVALSSGGTDFDHNVVALCKRCHGMKTAAENRARAAGNHWGRPISQRAAPRGAPAPRVADRLPDDVKRRRAAGGR